MLQHQPIKFMSKRKKDKKISDKKIAAYSPLFNVSLAYLLQCVFYKKRKLLIIYVKNSVIFAIFYTFIAKMKFFIYRIFVFAIALF